MVSVDVADAEKIKEAIRTALREEEEHPRFSLFVDCDGRVYRVEVAVIRVHPQTSDE